MTYQPHILVAFGGRLFQDETWSCGVRMHNGVFDSQDPEFINDANEARLEDLWADVASYVQSSEAGFSAAARLEWVKCNAIGPDGRYAQATRTVVYDAPTEDQVVGNQNATHAQVSLVVSLLGDRQRGRASRGRYYIPTGQSSPDVTGHLQAASCQTWAGRAAAFINDLNDWPGIDQPAAPTVHVMSALGSPGPRMEVSRVAVGNVMDTQRRRRSSLAETYYSAAVDV